MRLTVFAATLAFLLWGAPAFAGTAPDADSDGIGDTIDNCSDAPNPAQNDTDIDDCGNLCDADYNQTGVADFIDFGAFSVNFACTSAACENFQHVEPIGGGSAVGFPDFGFFSTNFGLLTGPSGTTGGSTMCP